MFNAINFNNKFINSPFLIYPFEQTTPHIPLSLPVPIQSVYCAPYCKQHHETLASIVCKEDAQGSCTYIGKEGCV